MEARDGIDFNEVDLWEIAAVTLPACPGAILLGPAKSFQQRATELRKLAADDFAYVAKATSATNRNCRELMSRQKHDLRTSVCESAAAQLHAYSRAAVICHDAAREA